MSADLAAYLALLGYAEPPPPTLDTLFSLHHAHLDALPYDNLDIMLGRPPPSDPADVLKRISRVGRAGYCFHHNGALGALLTSLGYAVERRHGHVWTDPSHRTGTELNHLVLLVRGLPTDDNLEGAWWPDVGLGDAFRDPVALVPGAFNQEGFDYALDDVTNGAWSFRHDPRGTFAGLEVLDVPLDIAGAHHHLSTSPASPFARLLVVQRRHADGIDTVRGCVLTQTTADGTTRADLTSYDEWRAALTEVTRLPVEDVPDGDLRGLWARTQQAHRAWVGAGRP